MIENQRIRYLCAKFMDNSISPSEMEELLSYIKEFGVPEEFDQVLWNDLRDLSNKEERELSFESERLFNRVEQRLIQNLSSNQKVSSKKLVKKILLAASVLLFVGGWLLIRTSNSPVEFFGQHQQTQIAPAGHRATIALSDGRTIELDSRSGGIHMDGHQITYQDDSSQILALTNTNSIEQLTLRTPRGGTYHITLPDGSKVWLNAESSIQYPSRFSTEERVVHLEGEAYFEVKALGSKIPFKVIHAMQTVEVLGTEFNISGYQGEEDVKTTLVEGKVRVHTPTDQSNLDLIPGEQSRVGASRSHKVKVDVRDYVDWKNGEFVFREETSREIMLRIARWYDIDVEYSANVTNRERFSGTISRYDHLQIVLDIMEEASGLDFEIQGRKVIVNKRIRK